MVKKEKKSDSNKISKVKLSETSLLSLEEFLDKLLLGMEKDLTSLKRMLRTKQTTYTTLKKWAQ